MDNVMYVSNGYIKYNGCETRYENGYLVVEPKNSTTSPEVATQLISILKQSLKTGVVNPRLEEGADLRQMSKKQQGFIAGLTTELGLDRTNLPAYISDRADYHELTEADASYVIDRLLAIREFIHSQIHPNVVKSLKK